MVNSVFPYPLLLHYMYNYICTIATIKIIVDLNYCRYVYHISYHNQNLCVMELFLIVEATIIYMPTYLLISVEYAMINLLI